MPRFLLFALLLICSVARSSELRLSLLEEQTSTTTAYTVDSNSLEMHQIGSASGSPLPQISSYSSINRKLVLNEKDLTDADEVLFQCHINEMDIVVVRVEYNSFFGPLKLLSALSGHPIQVSKIVVVAISGINHVSEKEVVRKDSSYHWVARILD